MRSLAREIAQALVFKILALAVLYLAFFNGSHKFVVTPQDMSMLLFQSHSMSQQ